MDCLCTLLFEFTRFTPGGQSALNAYNLIQVLIKQLSHLQQKETETTASHIMVIHLSGLFNQVLAFEHAFKILQISWI